MNKLLGVLLALGFAGCAVASLPSPVMPPERLALAGSPQTCQASIYTPGGNSLIACTKLFYVSATCGTPVFPGPAWTDVIWATAPWESTPITIIEADESFVFWNGEFLASFIGNSYQPDSVTPYESAQKNQGTVYSSLNIKSPFPAGSGMQFPASTGITDPTTTYHLDSHAWCPTGETVVGYIRIVYTIPPPA